MPAPRPSEPTTGRAVPAGPWAAFAKRHLFDYNPAARNCWMALALCGGVALAWALVHLRNLPWLTLAQLQVGIGFVAVAASFPVNIPRTRYHLGAADVFVLAILALYGAPAAALAAGVEGLVGACRSSKRLTSRVSTPAAATASMALAGLVFEGLDRGLIAAGLSPQSASLLALGTASLLHFAGTTLPLLAVMAVKNRQPLSMRDWAQGYSWLAAIYLTSALVAGVLVLNLRQFGATVIVAATLLAAVAVGLLRVSLARHEADRQAQEARIHEAEQEARINQQRFTAAFTQAAIGMAIVRPDGSIQSVNQALCRLLGQAPEALVERRFSALLHPDDAALFSRHSEALPTADNDGLSTELRLHDDTGRDLWVSLHCGGFVDPADDRKSLIYQLHDITSRRLAEDRLHHTAYHDSLTDLANRKCFNERLALAVEASRGDPQHRFSVLFLDLDRFKVVNDSLGHIAGNLLLKEVARRLSACVRPGDLVARLGGDEFAVLLEPTLSVDATLALAQRLLTALSQPLVINGTEVQPGASIGVTISDMGYRTTDEVLRDADLAMYAAKGDGRQRVVLFDMSMHQRVAERLQLEGELRHAIGDGQLSVVYQPLFDLNPYRLSGFEALARWEHPERGHISPAVFIALAEESGHIEALTRWVIDQAVGQLAQWRGSHPHLGGLDMHVNISGRDLNNSSLLPAVRDVLQRHAVPAHELTLEITETKLMGKLETTLPTLHALRELGVKFSIDDFGTGYSSLAYLSTLPIDSLKIDRSFVIGMSAAPQNVEIVRAVLNLGRSLGKKVIAEGIEAVTQFDTLKAMGVHVGQGYWMSRPLRAELVPTLLGADVAEPA